MGRAAGKRLNLAGWAGVWVNQSHDRSALVWETISGRARANGGVVSLRHVIAACADALAADGVALSVARTGAIGEPSLAIGPVAEQLEELQFTLGQGPGLDAVADRGPILVADLAAPDAQRRWPAFASAGANLNVGGVFAFPVIAGAALVGVLNVYRYQAGPLQPEELAQGQVYADAVLIVALDERAGIEPGHNSLLDAVLSARRVQVHQAAGMVAAQLGVPITDALAALRAHAYAHGYSLADLAAEVLARKVRLGHGPPHPGRSGGPPTDFSASQPPPGNVGKDRDKPTEPGGQPGGRQSEEG